MAVPDDVFQRGSSNCFIALYSGRCSLSLALVSIAEEHYDAHWCVRSSVSTQKLLGWSFKPCGWISRGKKGLGQGSTGQTETFWLPLPATKILCECRKDRQNHPKIMSSHLANSWKFAGPTYPLSQVTLPRTWVVLVRWYCRWAHTELAQWGSGRRKYKVWLGICSSVCPRYQFPLAKGKLSTFNQGTPGC